MNGDRDKDLPLAFYTGLNYLGRPTSVSVQGESPTAQAAGATPTGALGVGPTGAGGPASATPGGVAGSPDTSAATALQALGLTQNVASAGSKLGGLDTGPTTELTATLPEGKAALAASSSVLDPALRFGEGPTVTLPGELTTTLPEGQAALESGSAASEAASTSAGIEGTAALIPVVLSALQLAGVPIPKPITAAEQFGPVGTFTDVAKLGFNPSGANIANLIESFATFGLSDIGHALFGGHPPAMTFPGSTYEQIHSLVSGQLPPTLPVPPNASPEQQKAIQDANAAIKAVRDYITPEQPSWLGGRQSAETWNNVMHGITDMLQKQFATIQGTYPAALQAFQESGPMTMPQGAPPGLAEAITAANDPVTQLLTGLQKGAPYTGLSGLGETYTTASQAARDAMTRFGPQLEAAKNLPSGFFEGERRRLPEAA